MFLGKSLKFKIVASMVGLSLLTTIVISFTSVLKSSEIITNGAKKSFELTAKNISDQVYSELNQVEKKYSIDGQSCEKNDFYAKPRRNE